MPSSKDVSASLAYILTNKACPPLIPGTCSSPGTHNKIGSPEADRQGWVGMLVASLLPGQMAQLLGGRRGFLERCDCTAKGPIKQRTEVLTAANAFTWEQRDCLSEEHVCMCVCFLYGMFFPIKVAMRSKRERNSVKALLGLWVNLFAWKGCKIHSATLRIHYQVTKFLFCTCPLYQAVTQQYRPQPVATQLCFKATQGSPTSTGIRPLISLSEDFHSQCWINVREEGRHRSLLDWKYWRPVEGLWQKGSGYQGNDHFAVAVRLSRDTPVTRSGTKIA